MIQDWLTRNAPGFEDLPTEDREAIGAFLFLWSLFEAQALGENASGDAIQAAAARWRNRAPMQTEGFSVAFAYFAHRYYEGDALTEHFRGLRFRDGRHSDLVQAVLAGRSVDPVDQTASVLLIVYRLRNNLFHGVKWSYGLAGQRANFEHANRALMSALTLNAL